MESLPVLGHDVITPARTTLPSTLFATAIPFDPSVAPSVTVVASSPASSMPAVPSSHVTPTPSTTVAPPVGTPTTSSDTLVATSTASPHMPARVIMAGLLSGTPVTPPVVSAASSSYTTPSSDVETAGPDTEPMATNVVSTMARLLKAQTDAMTKAAAVQNLPPLPSFTGEGDDPLDDGYDKWVEKFWERAQFADWSPGDQLYQLKLHLDKTANDMFRMLLSTECGDIESAIKALSNRFKPRDIEELHGPEFYHKTQGDESIDQLGISI